MTLHKINYTNNCSKYENEIADLMQKNESMCETLPSTTTIEASIRTHNEKPIWIKKYPYPLADKEFVDKEVQKLLNNGIIERSFSPYNSPIWVVYRRKAWVQAVNQSVVW